MNDKPHKYTDIRNILSIDVDGKRDDQLAYLTHYFQNHQNKFSEIFFLKAKEYAKQTDINLKLPGFFNLKDYLPIRWNVPFPPVKDPQFSFIDLFAGIGGNRIAFQSLGGKCVFSSEWDKFAKKTYEANFGEVPFGDIREIQESDIPTHDILLAGFPCQPFSIAGVSKKKSLGRSHGFLDKTQGTLFFDIARIIKAKKPKAFLLENVKNLQSHDKKKTFEIIKKVLENLGYTLHYKVLNSKHFVPQNRERIIIVGFDKNIFKGKENFEFPELPEPDKILNDILDSKVPDKYTLSDKLWDYLQKYAKKHKAKGNGFGFGLADLNGISRTLSARYYKDGSEILIPQQNKNPRRLTPTECKRLQGFPKNFEIPVSDNQAYKQFGNSVTVPLIQKVGTILVREILKKNEPDKSKIAVCRKRV